MTSDSFHSHPWPEPPPPALRDDWFDRAEVGLALLTGGLVDLANATLGAFLGRRPEDLSGRPISDHVHPDHRGRVAAAIARANGEAEPLEIAWLRDGEPAWGITHVRGWRPGPTGRPRALLQVEDCVARAAAEGALRRHAERLRLPAGDGAVLLLGDDAMPRHALAEVREVLGVAPDAALRRRWGVAMHPEDEALIRALLRAVRAEPGAVGHAHARLGQPGGGGMWRDVDITLVNARDDPDLDGVVLSVRRRDSMSQETTGMTMQGSGPALAGDAGGGTPHLAAVLRLVKHEFRTPLTSIRGYAELIAGLEPEQGDVGEFARIIDQEAGKLSSLIDELLLLDQLEAGAVEVRLGPADLNGIVRELIRRLGLRAGAPEFRLFLDPLLPPVLGDYDRLTQLVGNLVEHALRASPPGAEIEIRTASDGRAARLAVSDLGGDLSEEDRERMFDRFQRLDAASGRVLRSGLSLPIARGIVRLHGGEIGAEPLDGSGATVWVTLPVARPDGP